MKRTLRLGQEACASLLANRLRTSLMMLGLVIGVASLTAVICIGQGTRAKVMHMVAKQGWDLIMVRAGSAKQVLAPTTDRTIASLIEADAQAIEAELGNIRYVSAVQAQRGWEVIVGDKSVKTRIFGVGQTWHHIRHRPAERGEFLSQADVVNMNKVAVLGWRTAKMLFGEANPVGQTIRIGTEAFQVKGVFEEAGVTPAAMTGTIAWSSPSRLHRSGSLAGSIWSRSSFRSAIRRSCHRPPSASASCSASATRFARAPRMISLCANRKT